MSRRADPFAIDLADFTPGATRAPMPAEAIRALSEASAFPSRTAQPSPALPRRRRTGRNVQIAIKATAETIDRFKALSDARGWAFGETLDHAIAALERDLA